MKLFELGMEKPSIEQVAWVFERLKEHMAEGGTFRYLIYDRMGFDVDAYAELYLAGGMDIHNVLSGIEREEEG